MTSPRQTSFARPWFVVVNHDYIWEWEQVSDNYTPEPDEVVGFNSAGRKARRIKNENSKFSRIDFHDRSIQDIHDDRHEARMAIRDHMATCEDKNCAQDETTPNHIDLPVKPDTQVAVDHIVTAVLPHLAPTEAITSFECEEFPQVAMLLNAMYGLGE